MIQQLRSGAPFAVVAAQFSQSQTALSGGDLGWLRTSQMDPQVAALVGQMPPGGDQQPGPRAGRHLDHHPARQA